MQVSRSATSFIVFLALSSPSGAARGQSIEPLERLPEHLQANLERRDRALEAPLPAGPALSFFLEGSKTWAPGSTLRVAFKGGSADLRQKIESTASEWARHANIKLDFKDGASYRIWSEKDAAYSANVRIGFDAEGYWSLVGTDSDDPAIVSPGEASMNFGGFDSKLPASWAATVLHEFGHALGFLHEHQHPWSKCEEQFRWNNDDGYVPKVNGWGEYVEDDKGRRPGIYTVLGGPPNRWEKATVDHNLRRLAETGHAFLLGPYDPLSIMKYAFPDWMYVSGPSSSCYSARNTVLSAGDMKGAALAYPAEKGKVTRKLQSLEDHYSEILESPSNSFTKAQADRLLKTIKKELERQK